VISSRPISDASAVVRRFRAGGLVAVWLVAAVRIGLAEPAGPGVTREEALARLLEGNRRYVEARPMYPRQAPTDRVRLAVGQHPVAMVFGCVDSRVPPELVFDQGLGDLFVIRTAGQVLDDAALGSLEFGVAELAIPLLVVLGHESCGAVKATAEAVEQNVRPPGHIGMLVDEIRPAVEQAEGENGERLDQAVRINVDRTVHRLAATPLLSDAVAAGRLKIVGARYDLDTGEILLLSPEPDVPAAD
jgi:carbonic anhydrase